MTPETQVAPRLGDQAVRELIHDSERWLPLPGDEVRSVCHEVLALRADIRKLHEISHTYYGGCQCEVCNQP